MESYPNKQVNDSEDANQTDLSQENAGNPTIENPSNEGKNDNPPKKNNPDIENKPLRRIGFMILGLLVANSYLLLTIYLLGIPITLDWISLSSGSIQVFTGSYPLIGPLVLISMLATIIIVYASLKVLSASRKSLLSLILALLCVPIVVSICLAFIANQSTFAGLFPLLPSDFSFTEIFGSISGWTYIVLPVVIIWMFVSMKNFRSQDVKLGKWSMVVFTIFLALFVAPVLGALSFMYYKGYFPTNNYSTVEELTSFHVMEPTWLPQDFKQYAAFKYFDGDEEYSEYVTTSYDVPILELGSDESGGLILLRQGLTKDEYDTSVSDDFEVTTEILNSSRDGEADLLFYESDEGNYLYNLSYYTDENVHIFITGVNLSPETLIEFANGLE